MKLMVENRHTLIPLDQLCMGSLDYEDLTFKTGTKLEHVMIFTLHSV